MSFIITAHNEASRISAKIANTIAQNYPGPLEILVASDCSTDRTDEIVRSYAPRVRLVRAAARRGKEAAQQLAIGVARGELLVFSDVATALAPDGVSRITANFADSTVGCVSSVDRFVDEDGRISGEGGYVRYEMFLRSLETRVNSLVGLSGSFFAARDRLRQLVRGSSERFQHAAQCRPARPARRAGSAQHRLLPSDHRSSSGVSTKSENRAPRHRGPESQRCDAQSFEIWMVCRQLASHKLCRWLVPIALALALVTNVALAFHSSWYLSLLGIQIGFYCAVASGWAGVGGLRIPFYFFVANFAILVAWFRYARGERMTMWSPSDRPPALPQVCSHKGAL